MILCTKNARFAIESQRLLNREIPNMLKGQNCLVNLIADAQFKWLDNIP
jgi:hypothetical protein